MNKENYKLILNDITINERVLTGKNSVQFEEYKSIARLMLSHKKEYLFEEQILKKFSPGVTLESLFEQNQHRFLPGFFHEYKDQKQNTWYDIEASLEIERGDELYGYFFACKLRQINAFEIEGFLNFHLDYSFKNNWSDYFDFLNIMLAMHRDSHFDAKTDNLINTWIEKEKSNHKAQALTGVTDEKILSKTKRARMDNKTSLTQEQTVLLAYSMRQTNMILKDEYLNDTDAGLAFSLLTGYSATTLRQQLNISQLVRISTEKNIEAVINALKELQTFVVNNLGPEEK